MDICQDIIQARGAGDLIVRIEPVAVECPMQAARLFGLFDAPDIYVEVSKDEARAVLVAMLVKDMAYGCPLVAPAEASRLADAFLGAIGSGTRRYFTNGDYGRPRVHPDIGPSGTPATAHTFDSGVLVLAAAQVGCAWFMDED